MKNVTILLFLLLINFNYSQTLPASRSVVWSNAGLNAVNTNFPIIDMQSQGVIGDGITPNDVILSNTISSNAGTGAILIFPAGEFLFNNSIQLPNNFIVQGQSANATTFKMDLGGNDHAIIVSGTINNNITTNLSQSATKNNNILEVIDSSLFNPGDWIHLTSDDSSLVTSSWANNTVGQISKIVSINGNQIQIQSPLRLNLDISNSPFIRIIDPVKNVGIECIKILRVDDTAPQQSSNIYFNYAVDSWVSGVESENCTFSHIDVRYSSNLYISKSYFHHAFNYGGGGRAYGVMLHFTTNECLVENNIFERLRHSMILQAGANGNVFSYNYSLDPFWTGVSLPNDSAGDIVLHGNYPFSNLFEQNIAQNIVIDNSHGPNGLHNTFFRNRAENYGITFSATNSPSQNFIGNEVTNTSFPVSLFNYNIQGADHFIFGNNNKGVTTPAGTNTLTDTSYAYLSKPSFIPISQWGKVGPPNLLNGNSIPAQNRYMTGNIFLNSCNSYTLGNLDESESNKKLEVFPNPTKSELIINCHDQIKSLIVINSLGQVIFNENIGKTSLRIETHSWKDGIYFLILDLSNGSILRDQIIKK